MNGFRWCFLVFFLMGAVLCFTPTTVIAESENGDSISNSLEKGTVLPPEHDSASHLDFSERRGPPGHSPPRDQEQRQEHHVHHLDEGPVRGHGGFGRRVEGDKGHRGRGPRDRRWRHEVDRRRDPKMYELKKMDFELERKSRAVSEDYKRVIDSAQSGPDLEEMRNEINELVTQHFDVRQKRRLLELQRVREQLKRLEESIESRADARKQIISRRLAELTGEEDDLSF